jgi:hypothetical protein
MRTKIFSIFLSLLVISFTSCKKDSSLIEQASLDLADDDAVSDAVYEDVFSTADNATIILDQLIKGEDSKSELTLTDSCPTIKVTRPANALWPRVVTVDYGSGCAGFYEATRSGKIVIEVSAPRTEVGSKRTVTFNNYFFNGIKVEGTKVFENTGLNSNNNPVISVKLTNGKLTLPDGKTIERSFNHQREWTAGYMTKNIWDDECLVTGTATGKTINGVAYTNTIVSALQWKRVCKFIVAGVVKIEREGSDAIELNYGTGECDAKAVVTKGTESKEILLRNKHRLMGNN